MSQDTTGRIVEVSTIPIGDTVAVGASVDDTEVDLNSTVDFNLRDGQTLQATCPDPTDPDVMLVFEVASVDHDNDAIYLTDPLTVDLPVDHPFYVYPTGDERVAQVMLDEGDDDPIPCRVPHALYDRIPEGIREPGSEEAVEIAEGDDGEWSVVDVLGQVPFVDGSYLDPETVTASTIQTAPSGSRVVIRDDEGSGLIEAFAGVDGEEPSTINPVSSGLAALLLTAGKLDPAHIASWMSISSGTDADPAFYRFITLNTRILNLAVTTVDLTGEFGSGSVGTGAFRTSVRSAVLKTGEFSGSTNGSAQVTITHGLEATPTSIGLTPHEDYGVDRHRLTYDNVGSTTFRVTVRNATTGLVSSPTKFSWQAFA